MRKKHNSKKRRWEKEILQWQKSQESIRSWCIRKEIPTSTFSYWKNIIFPKDKISLNKDSFTEVKENSCLPEWS